MNNLNEFKSYLQEKSEKWKHYYNVVGAFDIETTKFDAGDEIANYCYAWSFSLDGVLFKFGRDPEDFFKFLNKLNLQKKLVIYVQWLGYEYNNLTWLFDKYVTNDDSKITFKAGNLHKPLKIEGEDVIFKCSAALSGMGLAEMGNEIGLPKSKDLDYEVDRNRLTPMTEEEIGYCLRDVEIVCKWVRNAMSVLGCRVNELPLTAAGMYNIELSAAGWHGGARKAYAQDRYKDWNDGDYEKFRSAFKGGLIVYNPTYLNVYLSSVLHADIKSAFPAIQVKNRLPKKFYHKYNNLPISTQEKMIWDTDNWAVLAKFTFVRLRLKANAPCCLIKDLYIKQEYTAYMTNLEFKMLAMYYTYESVVWEDFQASELEMLPKQEIEVNLKLFAAKESAKGTAAYGIRKVQLNAGYGNKCKRLDRQIRKKTDAGWSEKVTVYKDIKDLDYYYPIGVWISAIQRFTMAAIIWEIGKDDFIYSNTDSIFCKNTDRAKEIIEKYNSTISFDKLGKFEMEDVYKFYIIGASRYAVIDKDNKVEVTFSGTNQKDVITLQDMQNYADGGGFIIPNGISQIYANSGVFEGEINGEKVVTYNYLFKETVDMVVSKIKLCDVYEEDK